jgi:uncharacterized damage-inducible protein DinB
MDLPEVWLRGPVPNIPALLQPAAHALLQCGEEVEKIMSEFPADKLWVKPAGAASVGFHLKHLTGVLDRLFTYARGESLTVDQLAALRAEEGPSIPPRSPLELVEEFNVQIRRSLNQLEKTSEDTLLHAIEIGRKKLPSTVLGVLFHAAEHSQRHTGQLLVTVRMVKTGP